MTFRTLIRRSLRFHARSHFGVVLGAAIGSAALIGALVVGDSVRGSLRERALERIGRAEYLLQGQDRVFSDSTMAFGDAYAAGLHLTVTASAKEGGARANRVNLYGVQRGFWEFSPLPAKVSAFPGNVLLNR